MQRSGAGRLLGEFQLRLFKGVGEVAFDDRQMFLRHFGNALRKVIHAGDGFGVVQAIGLQVDEQASDEGLHAISFVQQAAFHLALGEFSPL